MNFYIYISSHPYAVNSHYFPIPSLSLIPIPLRFPLSYSHSHSISEQAMQNSKVIMQTDDRRATEKNNFTES